MYLRKVPSTSLAVGLMPLCWLDCSAGAVTWAGSQWCAVGFGLGSWLLAMLCVFACSFNTTNWSKVCNQLASTCIDRHSHRFSTFNCHHDEHLEDNGELCITNSNQITCSNNLRNNFWISWIGWLWFIEMSSPKQLNLKVWSAIVALLWGKQIKFAESNGTQFLFVWFGQYFLISRYSPQS